MSTIEEKLGYKTGWTPDKIDLTPLEAIIKEANTQHDTGSVAVADSLAKRLLLMADHISDDLTRSRIYASIIENQAADKLNDVAASAIDLKTDVAKKRVGERNPEYRSLRDESSKASLLVGYLEAKYKELFALHYDFRNTAKRLAELSMGGRSGSDSDRTDPDFGTAQLPIG